MSQATERRAQPRVSADFNFQFAHAGSLMNARVRDISVAGVRCITELPVPIMTQVHMLITLPIPSAFSGTQASRSVSCAGAVVRSDPTEDAADIASLGDSLNAPAESGDGDDTAPAASAKPDQVDGHGQRGAVYDTAIFFTNLLEADRSTLAEFVTVRDARDRIRDETAE